MKELNAAEVNAVSGAGRLQDAMTSLGGLLAGKMADGMGSKLNINKESAVQKGTALGNKLGGRIESGMKKLPVIGGLFSKFFG